MTSLASPVHAYTALTPSLMAFYATVATVIPVLFIALAVQGTIVQQISRLFYASQALFLKRRQPPSGRPVYSAAPTVAGIGLLGIIGVIVGAGGFGESLAIYALYQGQDQCQGDDEFRLGWGFADRGHVAWQ